MWTTWFSKVLMCIGFVEFHWMCFSKRSKTTSCWQKSYELLHNNQSRFHSNLFFFNFFPPDSSGQVSSSPLGSPTSHRGMHPSLLSPTSMGPSGSLHSPISTLSSPMNGLASPFSVISSPMGPHSMNSPGMGYGPSVSPQVRPVTDSDECADARAHFWKYSSAAYSGIVSPRLLAPSGMLNLCIENKE